MTPLTSIDIHLFDEFTQKLQRHRLYEAITTKEPLRCFMEHHVFCVWDYMSLLKSLQRILNPIKSPWTPSPQPHLRRLINELVLEEESGETHEPNAFASHFEFYIAAMEQIGADTAPCLELVHSIAETGASSINHRPIDGIQGIPDAALEFMRDTLRVVERNQAHEIAAAFAVGRENITSCMFRSLLSQTKTSIPEASIFHAYLSRHIEVDEGTHADHSMLILNSLCDGDPVRINEAKAAAYGAISSRLKLWDSILEQVGNQPAVPHLEPFQTS